MGSNGPVASLYPGTLIGGRYTVEHVLGRGGMGSVYAVRDRSTSRRLALKCLQRHAALENGHAATLFQREYHTLSHLRHPRVIQVYDYGIDDGRPFYTMELLDGTDLRELAPVSWPRACAVLRDVASSLGLLHSRRLLHRDLSPRNVRCTRDGRAKLIDFGTMSPMGVSRDVAGTAPYMAPEAVHGQVLDARTDLYALGALAYWTLTGYDAHPARDSRELPALWTRPILSPSAMTPDIPPALDALVMSLLSLDADARPGHVAEVIERLTAIAALEPAEPLDVAHAFLTSPNLVGHSETLAAFRKRLVRAARGRGSAVAVRGAPGLGRSRLLQALVLEAKLSGVLVLTADADDAQRGELGVACTILEQLAETAPDLAAATFGPFADVLGDDFRALLAPGSAPPASLAGDEAVQSRRARRLNALREWLLAAAAQRPLLVAVDDADLADEHSAVWLTLLTGDSGQERLVVAVSYERESSRRALAMLSEDAVVVQLEPLDAQETTRLLRSVFGDVPNLQVVAHWVHGLAGGVPRTVMELAQYLVDHRIARYERGSWTLPATLRDQALPHSIEHALDQQLDGLGGAARELAEALALVTEHGQLEQGELAALCAFDRPEPLYAAVDELIAAQVLVVAGIVHHLRHRGLARALVARTPEVRRRQLHLRIAGVYERRAERADNKPEAGLLAAYHRYLAGDVAACAARLAQAGRNDGLAFTRSREAVAMYEACLAYGEAADMSPRQLYPLRKTLLQLSAVAEPSLIRHAQPTLDQLVRDSGRIYYDELADEPDPLLRVRKCVARARALHDQTDPALRGLDPVEGMFELGSAVLTLTRAYMARNDPQSLRALIPLIAPLAVLSAGFDLLHELAVQTCDSLLGQDVQQRRLRTLSRLELPMQGLDDGLQQAIRCVLSYWAGIDEAVIGKASALDRASVLERHPLYAPLGVQLRGIYHLFVGDEVEAEACHRRGELLELQSPYAGVTTCHGTVYEGLGYFLCGSVLGMRRVIATLRELVARHPGWQPELRRAEGLYALLRGEPQAALGLLDAPAAAASRVQALLALGDGNAARAYAERALAALDGREGRVNVLRLRATRALAVSACGEHAAAAVMLDGDMEQASREGVSGMLLCEMHEARARIAIELDDRATFRRHASQLGAAYGRATSGLRARYEQLGLAARRALMSVPPPPPSGERRESQAVHRSDVHTQLELGQSRERRMRSALTLLAEHARASRAFLFGMQPGGLRLAAALDGSKPPEGLDDMLAFYMDAELASSAPVAQETTGTFTPSVDMVAWINDGEQLYYPVLLHCIEGTRRMIAGVAVLALPIQREPRLPRELASEIGRALIRAGDVIGAEAAD